MSAFEKTSVPGLTFNDEEHRYRFDNRDVPGVTRVLDVLRDFKGIPLEVLQKAGDLGSLVHDATELDSQGMLDEESVDDEVWPYLRAWRLFVSERRPKFRNTEHFVYHPKLQYAGKYDHFIVDGGVEVLIDKKTSAPSKVDGVQLSAYREAAGLPKRTKLRGLYLQENGKYKLVEYGDDQFPVFCSALHCYRFKQSK